MNSFSRLVAVAVIALVSCGGAFAESKVSGTVKDVGGAPVADVTIRLDPSDALRPGLETKTKKKGTYFFAMVRRGQYKLTAAAEGKRVSAVDVRVRDSDGHVTFEQQGELQPGAPLPQIDIGDTDVATYDLVLAESTVGGGAFGTGVALLGTGQIVELIQKGQTEKARSEIDRSLETDPKNATTHYLKAFLEMQAENPDAALAAIDACLAVEPTFAGARLLRGALLEKKGDSQGALGAYKEEAESASDASVRKDAWVRIAVLAKAQDWKDEKIAALRKIIELEPGNTIAYAQLVDHYALSGDQAALLALLETAPDEIRNDPLVHFNLGAAIYNSGKPAEAAAEFRKVIEIQPDLAEAHKLLGYCQVGSADYAGAIASFQRYLELAPQAPDAGEVRSLIEGLQQRKK